MNTVRSYRHESVGLVRRPHGPSCIVCIASLRACSKCCRFISVLLFAALSYEALLVLMKDEVVVITNRSASRL